MFFLANLLVYFLFGTARAYCDLGSPLRPRHELQLTPTNFSYAGENGQFHWANLPGWVNNRACATGRRQSPINIDASIPSGPSPVILYADEESVELQNLGTTLEANPRRYNIVHVDGVVHYMVNFHFHTPSEHRINNEHYPLEMHIVHSAGGRNVVLTILFKLSANPNAFLSSVLEHASELYNPGDRSRSGRLQWTPIIEYIKQGPRKSYEGSLTTPPCTENTRFILSTGPPLEMNVEQYNEMKAILKFNSRTLQGGLGKQNLLQLNQPLE